MPLVSVQRYAPQTSAVSTDGTQYIDGGTLTFAGSTTITLSRSVYATAGNYVLFDYSAGTFSGNQATLDTNVIPYLTFDPVDGITGFSPLGGTAVLEDDVANERIIVKLVSNPTNGCQYVDGNLTIDPTLTIYLNPTLYATPGTYILFQATTITPGSENNISIVGRPVVSGPTIVSVVGGFQIQVTLA